MGLFVSDWASSFLLTEVIGILISEIIGYHVQILPTVGRSAEGQGEFRPFFAVVLLFYILTLPETNSQFALKIDDWKMKFPFKMVPFQGTCQFSGGIVFFWYCDFGRRFLFDFRSDSR